MKKTYTRCSASLFIGLLSLHTLSSCVNTGQKLGIYPTNEIRETRRELARQTHMLMHTPPNHREYPKCRYCKPWYAKPLYQATGITTGLVGAGLLYYLLSAPDHMEGTAANAKTALASTVGTGVANMTNTTLASIGQAAATVAAVTTTTLLPTAGLITSLRPNGWNSNSSVATSFIPDHSTTPITKQPEEWVTKGGASDRVKDPMFLDHQIISDLNKSFSAARIQYWLDNGLNIDAKDDVGRNLLMVAAAKGNLESVQFIIEKGVNVHEQDKTGNTALHYVACNIDKIHNINAIEPIVKDLLKHGIDPCIKNQKGKKAIDYIFNAKENTIKDKVKTLLSKASEKC